MTERFKLSLSGMWLIASFFSLVLPVFLPSYADAPGLTANTIGAATATMFILSFPSSLFGIPVLYAVNYVLGIDSASIQGMYVNLLMLFFLGIVQWFWIVPRVWRNDPAVQRLDLRSGQDAVRLTEVPLESQMDYFDLKDRTPLERALDED